MGVWESTGCGQIQGSVCLPCRLRTLFPANGLLDGGVEGYWWRLAIMGSRAHVLAFYELDVMIIDAIATKYARTLREKGMISSGDGGQRSCR